MHLLGNSPALVAVLLFVSSVSAYAAAPTRQLYIPSTASCDGYPRLAIDMVDGYCAGFVLGPTPGSFRHRAIRMPRMLLPLADGRGWIVTDLGLWTERKGSVWRVEAERNKPARLTKLFDKLSLPHTVAFGPDGWVYVGEMSRIFRFDIAAPDPAGTLQVVVSGLPYNKLHDNRHPLSHFIFDANGDLLVNVGAASDQCAPDGAVALAPTCAEGEGDDAKAVIRRYVYLGGGKWESKPTVLARGLRNSLVLVRHKSGTLLQAENSFDFAPSADLPYDEVNVIRPGAHFGWPYCADMNRPTPAWIGTPAMDCSSAAHEKPAVLLPPHAAPLGAIYYEGSMFPALQGKLLMTWHGYRPSGSRLVAFDVDDKGIPTRKPEASYAEYAENDVIMKSYYGPAAEPTVLTPGWNLQPGIRPAGAPVGLAVAQDGAIWIADDRSGAVLRIAVDGP
jgi:glucose/arabinose dehydrogenase